MQTDREGIPFLVVCNMAEEREGYIMMRGTVLHYVKRDGGVFDVYFVKGENCSLSYMFGLPNYQSCENKYYDLDDVFHIAWDNFSIYEEMLDDE